MSKAEFENHSLVVIIVVCYVCNLVTGWVGAFLFPDDSWPQMLLYQAGNAFGISGSVMAGRYIGLRGQHVAASACILLGITHGIGLAALGRTSVNVDRGITMVMPMIPALIFMFWCDLFPRWVRAAGLIPIACFTTLFVFVHRGYGYREWPLNSGYASLQILEIIWAVYLYRDWKRSVAAK